MDKADAQEAATICNAVLAAILAQTLATGSLGASLRFAVSNFRVNAPTILQTNAAGPPLENIFRLADANGISLSQMDYVRAAATNQPAVSDGAMFIRDALIYYALATEGLILSRTSFVSRDDVEAARTLLNAAFAPAQETVADARDPVAYTTIVSLQASVNYFLTMEAQPLPRMLTYQFAAPLPTLVIAYRLYADASRADEIRAQNRIIHPAFAPMSGRALSQ
jgi:prophage DNA circulation protein